MISRGLLISLVVTGVSTACLWLYFKNRLGECEKKVDLMFDFIQDHEQRQMQTTTNDNIQVSFNSEEKDDGVFDRAEQYNATEENLIQVSDDEDSDEQDSDEQDSDEDSDEQDTDEDNNDGGEVSGEEIVLKTPNNNEVKIEDNLSELTEMKNVVVEDQETINLQKNEIDSLDELSDMDSESEDVVEENTPIDYTKLTMSVLKEVADKKGLTGYKSLKKAALINLIENN
jgi:hypothetical protein